ncbi:MAG: hypothetical protein AAF414_15640 [Pseudomonadota bacterium]
MAKIAVITHDYDCFMQRRFGVLLRRRFLLQDLLRELRNNGHRVEISVGTDRRVEADVGILHIDCSVIPTPYLDLANSYDVTVNGSANDITKRTVGGAGLKPDSDWDGPVIVKSNFNSGGRGEHYHNREALRRGHAKPHPSVDGMVSYNLYDTLSGVPEDAWADGSRVVERLIPEPDPQGYAMRTWIFFGDRERCTRYVGPNPIIKGADIIARSPAPVPDELRAERERLGFDYGKFDFVVHDGKGVLLDANRTPGSTRNLGKALRAANIELIKGFDALIR